MIERLEQPSVSNKEWEDLKTIKYRGTSPANERSNLSPEIVERHLRNELLGVGESFCQQEHAAYSNLTEELSRSGFDALVNPIESLGDSAAKIDTKRIACIVGYIDRLFLPDTDDPDSPTSEDLKQEYLKDTRARAEEIFKSTDGIHRILSRAENNRFEGVIHYVDRLKDNAPDSQTQLAYMYFQYFDNPSDDTRRRLTNRVDDYTASLCHELNGVSSEIIRNNLGDRDLPGASHIVGRSLSRGYEELHSTIMKYYDCKLEHFNASTKNTTPPFEQTQTIPPDSIPSSPSGLPSDIF